MSMQQPVLFIGIGSSGLYTLEQIQNFYYENTGKNKPSFAEYLYLETNKDNSPGITAVENEIRRVYISLADMQIMIVTNHEKCTSELHEKCTTGIKVIGSY